MGAPCPAQEAGAGAHSRGRQNPEKFIVVEPSAATKHMCIIGVLLNIWYHVIVAEPAAAKNCM